MIRDNHKRPRFQSLPQLQNISRFSVSDHMSSRTSLIPGHFRNFYGDELHRKANNGGPSSLGFHDEAEHSDHPSCSNKNQINIPKKIPNYYPPDYQSEAPVRMNNVEQEELATSTSSAYSLGDTSFSLERMDQESYPSSENEEDERVRKSKRRRTYNSEIHNLSEKKRRDKINKKMRTLQALVPNSDKVDKATMLDNAIDYLKGLQLQYFQLMTTMGSRACMMTLPMGMGLGMRMPFGVGFCPTIPFPNAPMLGLNAARMLPMPTPPFFPIMTNATQPRPLPTPPNSGSPAFGSIG